MFNSHKDKYQFNITELLKWRQDSHHVENVFNNDETVFDTIAVFLPKSISIKNANPTGINNLKKAHDAQRKSERELVCNL
jgi:hypothetical protein